jgi:hypothetical protein
MAYRKSFHRADLKRGLDTFADKKIPVRAVKTTPDGDLIYYIGGGEPGDETRELNESELKDLL